jgi:hypothetical protein
MPPTLDQNHSVVKYIIALVFAHDELRFLAMDCLDRWMKETWKDCWKDAEQISDIPDEFSGHMIARFVVNRTF